MNERECEKVTGNKCEHSLKRKESFESKPRKYGKESGERSATDTVAAKLQKLRERNSKAGKSKK